MMYGQISKEIREDLAQHGFKVKVVRYRKFGTICFVTIDGEIFTFFHVKDSAYQSWANYLHDNTLLGPETTDYMIVDPG